MFVVFNQTFCVQNPAMYGYSREEKTATSVPVPCFVGNLEDNIGFKNRADAEDFASWLAKKFSDQEFHLFDRLGTVKTNPPTLWSNLKESK